MAVKKKINILKDIKNPEIRKELLYYFSLYKDIKSNKFLPSIKDLLTIDVEKALKKKNYKEAKIHLLTLGVKEEYLDDYIKGRKQLRKVN
jgi:hypothetical protein